MAVRHNLPNGIDAITVDASSHGNFMMHCTECDQITESNTETVACEIADWHANQYHGIVNDVTALQTARGIGAIVALEGDTLARVKQYLGIDNDGLTIVELAINDDGLRIKANYGIWTPPFGTTTE